MRLNSASQALVSMRFTDHADTGGFAAQQANEGRGHDRNGQGRGDPGGQATTLPDRLLVDLSPGVAGYGPLAGSPLRTCS